MSNVSEITNPLHHIYSSCRRENGRSIAINSLDLRARNPRRWPFTLSSARGDHHHSFPRHHIVFPALSLFGIIGTPPDCIATLIQYLATAVCSCAVVALALATMIERPVGPLVPNVLQRLDLANIGARGLLCYAATQLLTFAVVAGIKEECENVTLETVSGPTF